MNISGTNSPYFSLRKDETLIRFLARFKVQKERRDSYLVTDLLVRTLWQGWPWYDLQGVSREWSSSSLSRDLFFSPSDEIYDEISGVDFVRHDPLTPTRPALYGQFYGHHGLVGIQTNGCPYEEES